MKGWGKRRERKRERETMRRLPKYCQEKNARCIFVFGFLYYPPRADRCLTFFVCFLLLIPPTPSHCPLLLLTFTQPLPCCLLLIYYLRHNASKHRHDPIQNEQLTPRPPSSPSH